MSKRPAVIRLIIDDLKTVRTTWKKEERRATSYRKSERDEANGVSFIDGIVYGLTLAINVVDKYRRNS